MEIAAITEWTFVSQVDIPQDITSLMVGDEVPHIAFKTFRDVAIFTSKRLIVKDAQGFTGKKIEVYSLPYSSISMWSSENAGTLDLNAELELWTRAGKVKIKIGKDLDIRYLDNLIANYVLGS